MRTTRTMWLGWRRRLQVVLLPLALVACGGGSDGVVPSQPAGSAVIGLAGGIVQGEDGAQVVVPPGAMDGDATIRIAKDSTDMPALPDYVEVVGSAWQVTPHGSTFSDPVQVVLPAPARPLAATEELRVAKVSPGGQWELLTPEATRDAISVNVQSFSYFVPVAVRYVSAVQALPALALQSSTYTCNGGPCLQILPDSADMQLTVSSNRGEVPQGCTNPQLRLGSSGGVVVGATTPLAFVPNRTVASYSFQLSVATSSPTSLIFTRAAASGEVSVQLLCSPGTATESRITMASVPVRFPGKQPSATGASVEAAPAFGMSTESLSCNGGPCTDLIGPQDVRLTVAVAPGSILPAGCTAPLTLGLKTSASQPLLAETDEVPTAGSPLSTGGGSFAFNNRSANTYGYFRVNPPVPAKALPLFYGGKCGNGQLFNGGHVMLNFVAAQQATAPAFTTQPVSMMVREGQTASFTAVVSGFGTPALQWYSRLDAGQAWVPVSGATNATLTTAPTTLADNGRQYRLTASNTAGSVDSVVVTLAVSLNELGPVIATQPTTLHVIDGSDAVFAVVATGTGSMNYQWYHAGTAITGANGSILRLAAVGNAQAGAYTVRISNAAGSATSQAAQLVVSATTPTFTAPSIVTQPAAVSVNEGNTATFAVGVGGTAPFSYQWLKEGQPIEGATAAYYSLASTTSGAAGSYSVRVSNGAGSVTSATATLSVDPNAVPTPVVITTQPSAQVQLPGGSATFAVAASGSGPIAYQWLKNGVPIAGAGNAVLVLSGVTGSDAGSYAVTVSNSLGSLTSNGAALAVVGAPAITTQPAGQSVVEGSAASFSVAAAGSALGYQWTRDGVAIPGATAASYTTPALGLVDSGSNYGVVVYNGAGVVVSSPALLLVSAAPSATPAQARGKLAAAYLHTCAITAANAVACWGHNSSGQIGTGSVQARSTPYVWSLPEAAVSVSAGANASCAVSASGNVWCSGSPLNTLVPTQLAGWTGVRQVAVGQMHTCLLAGDATVWCWGANGSGQLGNGGTSPSATPVQVQAEGGAALTGVRALQAGLTHTCAALDDYSTRCWGTNSSAQSGAAAGVATTQATNVAGAIYADQLALGGRFSCAYIGEGGQVRCWGLALDGSGNTSPVATSVFDLNPAAVGAGEAMACAITNAGAVYCWGTGMMGNGNVNQNQWTPTAVSGLTGALAMAGGQGHSCVLRNGGSLQCWGSSSDYQLGLGDSVPRTTPAEVSVSGGFWKP